MFNGRQGPGGINGSNPLIYTGSTPNMVTFDRRPTVQDGFSWPIGMWWIIPIDDTFTTGEVWTLVSKSENINRWKRLRGSGIGPTPMFLINKIFLTTTGAGTYTPTDGMVQCYVECQGAGSGSFTTGGSGGSAGGYCAKLFTDLEIGSSQTYSVGAGGAASTAGDDTTFGSFLTAHGGTTNFLTGDIYVGGTATGGDINIQGGYGSSAITQDAPLGKMQGQGGSSVYGIGAPFIYTDGVTNNQTSGLGYGSGASGATPSGTSGQPGIIIITEYIG